MIRKLRLNVSLVREGDDLVIDTTAQRHKSELQEATSLNMLNCLTINTYLSLRAHANLLRSLPILRAQPHHCEQARAALARTLHQELRTV